MPTAPNVLGVTEKREKTAEGSAKMTEESTFHYFQGISFTEYSDDHKWKRNVAPLSLLKMLAKLEQREEKVR